jgi:hypothetical protein
MDVPKFYDCKTWLYEFLLVDISLLFMFLFDFMLKLGQTTQRPNEKVQKDKQRSTKHYTYN